MIILFRCEHTKIGNELFKGVSGGERKRCCIGMELVTKPKILFLGESQFYFISTHAFTLVPYSNCLNHSGFGFKPYACEANKHMQDSSEKTAP